MPEKGGARSKPKGALRCFGTELGRKFPAPPVSEVSEPQPLSSPSPDCAAGSLLLAAERPTLGMHSARLDAFVSHLRAEVVNWPRGRGKIGDAVVGILQAAAGFACMRITECGVQVGRPPPTEPLASDQERERARAGPGGDFLKDGLCRGSNRDSRRSDEAALARAASVL